MYDSLASMSPNTVCYERMWQAVNADQTVLGSSVLGRYDMDITQGYSSIGNLSTLNGLIVLVLQ